MTHTKQYETTLVHDAASQDALQSTLLQVAQALSEKGYPPVSQLSGYLISGEPAYITNHNNARSLISRYDRYDLLETILDFYIKHLGEGE